MIFYHGLKPQKGETLLFPPPSPAASLARAGFSGLRNLYFKISHITFNPIGELQFTARNPFPGGGHKVLKSKIEIDTVIYARSPGFDITGWLLINT